MPIKIPMMAITTKSSTKVKPDFFGKLETLILNILQLEKKS